MNILLVRPWYEYPYSKGEVVYNRIWPALCLLNCAAILEKEGHRVSLLDAHALRIKPQKALRCAKGFDKIFITSSALDQWQCPHININSFIHTTRELKKTGADLYVMGYHGTVEPEKILKITSADAVICGEPEYCVRDICRNLPYREIKGLAFFEEGKLVLTFPREMADLKEFPMPAFHLLDARKYFYELLGGNFFLFETSRGCLFECSFCNKIMYGKGRRSKSILQVTEEICTAVEHYSARTGYFFDLDFLSGREMVEGICDFLIGKKYNFNWACQTRPDLLDKDIILKMKRAGCKLMHMGAETLLPNSSGIFNKKVDSLKIEESFSLCKKAGIKTLAFVLFGMPGEKEDERRYCLSLVKRINPDFVSFHKLFSYKGSILGNSGIISGKGTEKFIRRAFLEFYFAQLISLRMDIFNAIGCLRLLLSRIITL